MKKEKRELTLEQLERKEKFFAYILPRILTILLCLISAFLVIIHEKGWISVGKTISIYIVIILFLFVIVLLNYKVSDKIENKIEKQMKLEVLKQLAKEHGGNIKEFVSLMEEKVITTILSKNIEEVVIDFTEDLKVAIITIYFSIDELQSSGIILKEDLMFFLDEEYKKEILNNCVENIKSTKSCRNTRIVISGQGLCHTDEKISDDELLEMFELKD